MTTQTKQPPLFPYSRKREGDRVKVPLHPGSITSSKFFYGTIRDGVVRWDNVERIEGYPGTIYADDICLMDA